MNNNDLPVFPGFRQPTDDFRAVRDGRRAPLLWIDVDLATARSVAAATQLTLPIAANFLYVDQRPNTGFATAHFQDTNPLATPVTLFAGALWRVPFTKIAFENAAQPGTTLRLIYGLDVDALPISAAGVTVLNAININDQINTTCQRIFNQQAAAVGTTVTSLVAIAANTLGAVVRTSYITALSGAGGAISVGVIAAAAAPASLASAAAQVELAQIGTTNNVNALEARYPPMARRLPANWGIWAVDVVTVAAGSRNVALSVEIL